MRTSFIALGILFILFLTGCGGGVSNPDALIDEGLNDFSFYMLQGDPPKNERPTVIEFWATWCGPCIKQFPHLNQLYTELQAEDIQFIAVTDEPFNFTREFLNAHKVDYPVAIDTQNTYARAVNVAYIPYAAIVNADGQIVWTGHSGKLTLGKIKEVLAQQ